MNAAAKLAVMLILGAVVAGAAVFWWWPETAVARSQAVSSYIQLLATLALIFLTFSYVRLTAELVAAENRPPKIQVSSHYVELYGDAGLKIQFIVVLANPSARANSIRPVEVEIEGDKAVAMRWAFESCNLETITVPARALIEPTLNAVFHSCPVAPGEHKTASLIFEDIFLGNLPSVTHSV